jgi:hypothetical protein
MNMPMKNYHNPIKLNQDESFEDETNQFRVRTALPKSRNDQYEIIVSCTQNGNSLPVFTNDNSGSKRFTYASTSSKFVKTIP